MQLSDLRTRVLQRIEVDPTDALWQFAATAALNEGQRIFAFLTLCLEVTRMLPLTSGVSFYNLLATWADFIVPLRVKLATKLRAESLFEMAMADPSFLSTTGTPTRYGCIGADLLYLNKRPGAGLTLSVTFARMPALLALDTDVPDILEADHEALIAYAIPRLRANEGGLELKNSAPLFASFVDYVKTRAADVRDRSNRAGLDNLPHEIGDAL